MRSLIVGPCSFRFAVLVVLGAVLACTPQTDHASHVMHDAAGPLTDAASWRWHETTDAQFEAIQRAVGESSALYDADSLPTKRVQFWVDLIDSKLRERHPGTLANVPHPRVKLYRSSEVNAYVNRAFVCLPVAVKITKASTPAPSAAGPEGVPQGVSPAAEAILLETDGTYTVLAKESCTVTRPDAGELDVRLAILNANRAGCVLAKSDKGVVLSAGCTPTSGSGQAESAPLLAVATTSNIVSVFAGLLSEARSEEEMVAIVAHELGHYYRAHATVPVNEYNYFYANTGDANAPRKPLPDASLDATGKAAAKYSSLGRYVRVPGQQLRSELFSWTRLKLLPRLKAACTAGSKCESACEPWFRIMADGSFKAGTKGFPLRTLSPEEVKNYFSFEAALFMCGKSTVLAELDAANGAAIQKGFESLLLPAYQELDLTDVPAFLNVEQGLVQADALFEKRELAAETARLAAARAGLGYYTTEQEADELSASFLALIGIDPKATLEGQFLFGRDMEKNGGNALSSEIPMDECAKLLARGWKDTSGKPEDIPIGSFSDPHHGTCYRIYNLDRELRGHDYLTSSAPQKPALEWSAVVDAL